MGVLIIVCLPSCSSCVCLNKHATDRRGGQHGHVVGGERQALGHRQAPAHGGWVITSDDSGGAVAVDILSCVAPYLRLIWPMHRACQSGAESERWTCSRGLQARIGASRAGMARHRSSWRPASSTRSASACSWWVGRDGRGVSYVLTSKSVVQTYLLSSAAF